jgi:hypothetical protein
MIFLLCKGLKGGNESIVSEFETVTGLIWSEIAYEFEWSVWVGIDDQAICLARVDNHIVGGLQANAECVNEIVKELTWYINNIERCEGITFVDYAKSLDGPIIAFEGD